MDKMVTKELIKEGRRKYAKLVGKKERGIFLDRFCETTSLTRKYAQKVLSGKREGTGKGRRKNKGRPRKYSDEDVQIIREIWLRSNQYCAARLKGALQIWLPSYRHHGIELSEEQQERLLGISVSQIERFISKFRIKCPRKQDWRRGRSVSAIKSQIEVRAERWNVQDPGWLEADCVALCGGNMGGEFIWILTVTDVWSGWTEVRPMWNRSARKVIDHYGDMEKCTPFSWKGIDTDNGGEFISWETLEWRSLKSAMGHKLHLTRSRPYSKNDQAYVEEKNHTLCREFFGYERYGYQQIMSMMQELCEFWSLFNNLYRPTMKQISREREGSKVKRKHEKMPLSPAQRIMAHPSTPPHIVQAIKKTMEANNPFEMAELAEKSLRKIWKVIREMEEKAPGNQIKRDEIAERYGKLNLRYASIELAISGEKL